MTEHKHTPGPWRWQKHNAYGIDGVLEPYMCQSTGFIEVSDANARLIAAAPELLDALEELRSELRDYGPDHPAMKQIDTAIAKAKGD